jgi:aspartate/methionine/tyrosine aminotransferase
MIQAANRINHVKEYYFSLKLKEIAQLNQGKEKVLNLGIGNPDLSPSEETWTTLRESCNHPLSHGYQGYQGIPQLRSSFARWYQNYFDVQLDETKEILPLMGSKEGIMMISMAYLNPGDKVLIPDPGYPTYQSVTQLLGGEIMTYPLQEENNWQPNLEQLEQENLEKVKIMWVNYPHMPTGARGSKQLLQNLVDFARKHKILIVNDNPYSFILNEEPISIMNAKGARECALELNSLSKSHNMPGWRVGMICGNQDLLEPVLKVKTNMDSGMFYPVQQAAIKALSQGPEWYESINKVYKKRRTKVYELLKLLACRPTPNQSGMFVWAAIPDNYPDSYQISDEILKNTKVFITPGAIFGQQGSKYIRISLCSSMTVLEEAIQRIKEHPMCTPEKKIIEKQD